MKTFKALLFGIVGGVLVLSPQMVEACVAVPPTETLAEAVAKATCVCELAGPDAKEPGDAGLVCERRLMGKCPEGRFGITQPGSFVDTPTYGHRRDTRWVALLQCEAETCGVVPVSGRSMIPFDPEDQLGDLQRAIAHIWARGPKPDSEREGGGSPLWAQLLKRSTSMAVRFLALEMIGDRALRADPALRRLMKGWVSAPYEDEYWGVWTYRQITFAEVQQMLIAWAERLDWKDVVAVAMAARFRHEIFDASGEEMIAGYRYLTGAGPDSPPPTPEQLDAAIRAAGAVPAFSPGSDHLEHLRAADCICVFEAVDPPNWSKDINHWSNMAAGRCVVPLTEGCPEDPQLFEHGGRLEPYSLYFFPREGVRFFAGLSPRRVGPSSHGLGRDGGPRNVLPHGEDDDIPELIRLFEAYRGQVSGYAIEDPPVAYEALATSKSILSLALARRMVTPSKVLDDARVTPRLVEWLILPRREESYPAFVGPWRPTTESHLEWALGLVLAGVEAGHPVAREALLEAIERAPEVKRTPFLDRIADYYKVEEGMHRKARRAEAARRARAALGASQ